MAKFRRVFWPCLFIGVLLSSCSETRPITINPRQGKTFLTIIVATESAGELMDGLTEAGLHPLIVSDSPLNYADRRFVRMVITVDSKDRPQIGDLVSGLTGNAVLRSIQVWE